MYEVGEMNFLVLGAAISLSATPILAYVIRNQLSAPSWLRGFAFGILILGLIIIMEQIFLFRLQEHSAENVENHQGGTFLGVHHMRHNSEERYGRKNEEANDGASES
jgi:hypothetical protein